MKIVLNPKTRFQTAGTVILIILIVFLIFGGIIGTIVNVFRNFMTPSVDTTALTNLGFAFAITLSGTCFSWYRTFESTETKALKIIKKSGERFLFAGILFITASLLKYISIITQAWQKKYALINLLGFLNLLIYALLFVVCIVVFSVALINVLKYILKEELKISVHVAEIKVDKVIINNTTNPNSTKEEKPV